MRTLYKPVFGFLLSFFFVATAHAQPSPGGGGGPGAQLNSWHFDNTNWLSGIGYPPLSFYNISNGTGGDGNTLFLNSTNPAVLNYYISEVDYAHTNLVLDNGSLSFWFRPSWSSADQGGTGPGVAGRLIEVGAYTTYANVGWWSLYLDSGGTNLYFSTQDNAGHGTNYLTAPVSFTSNVWTYIALTYYSNSTALFTNSVQIGSGDGISIVPSGSVLNNGFFIGSDSNGLLQAQGDFDDLATYNFPLDPNSLSGSYNVFGIVYFGPTFSLFSGSGSSYPTNTPLFNVIGGPGPAQWVSASGSCLTNSNVYFTNFSAAVQTNGTTTITFDIAGGTNGMPYDIFACAPLQPGSITNSQWYWMGQGFTCNTYRITNQPNAFSFYVMGTAQDSDADGLTDAFELLVSKTAPNHADTDNDGIPDAWAVLHGIAPTGNASQDPDSDGLTNLQEYNYGTDPLHWEGFTIWVGNPGSFGF